MTVSNQPPAGTSGSGSSGEAPGSTSGPVSHEKVSPEAMHQGINMFMELGAKFLSGHKSGDKGNSSSDSIDSSREEDLQEEKKQDIGANAQPPDPTAAADQAKDALYQGISTAMPPSIRGNPNLEKLFEGGCIDAMNSNLSISQRADIVAKLNTNTEREAYGMGAAASQNPDIQTLNANYQTAVENVGKDNSVSLMTTGTSNSVDSVAARAAVVRESIPPEMKNNPAFMEGFELGMKAGMNPSSNPVTGDAFKNMSVESKTGYIMGVSLGKAAAYSPSTENSRADSPDLIPPDGQAGDIPPNQQPSASGNRFMSNLLSVALMNVEQKILRMESQIAKLMSTMWLVTQDMLKSLAHESAALILKKAETEFEQHMGQAICSAAGAIVSGAAAAKGLTTKSTSIDPVTGRASRGFDSARGNMWSQAISGVGTGITGTADHLIQGVSALEIGQIDALNTIIQQIQQQLQAAANNYLDARKQAEDAKAQIIQLIMKIIDAQAALGR